MSRAQFTATEAAMSSPPLSLSPVLLLDCELAVLVESSSASTRRSCRSCSGCCRPGRSSACRPTCRSRTLPWRSSTSGRPSLVWLVVVASDRDAADGEAAVELGDGVRSMTLTATAAPIATLSPPAAPFELSVDSRSSLAVIEAAPVNFSAAPVPTYAFVWSLDDRRSRPTARSRCRRRRRPCPRCRRCGGRSRRSSACRSRRPRTRRTAPSVIEASFSCWSRATLIAAEAPMPTLPLFASESAFA